MALAGVLVALALCVLLKSTSAQACHLCAFAIAKILRVPNLDAWQTAYTYFTTLAITMGIFSKESLVQSLAGAACFSIIQMIVLIVLGALLVSNQHYHQLLSYDVRNAGGGLIFTGLMYVVAAVLGFYSARTLNKFLMLLNFLLLAALIFFQMMFGSIAVGRTASSYSHDFQVSCLTVGGYEKLPYKTQLECEEFFRSNSFAGMSLVWQSYYTKSLSDGNYRAMVLNFQKENFCCGNGLPIHCVNDSRAFPANYAKPVVHSQRRLCGSQGSFAYPPTKECKSNARCEYDLPYGTCGTNPITLSTRGCGAFVFQTLSGQVAAIGTAALVFLTFPIMFLIATVCLCLKRRDPDVMPDVAFVAKVKVHAEG